MKVKILANASLRKTLYAGEVAEVSDTDGAHLIAEGLATRLSGSAGAVSDAKAPVVAAPEAEKAPEAPAAPVAEVEAEEPAEAPAEEPAAPVFPTADEVPARRRGRPRKVRR
ncbi:MAG: hypothetical protein J6V65_03825 [Fibrobacterales bacterium]|nr:hypothetical protein [Fibrobacterales bacterium]